MRALEGCHRILHTHIRFLMNLHHLSQARACSLRVLFVTASSLTIAAEVHKARIRSLAEEDELLNPLESEGIVERYNWVSVSSDK